MQFKLSWELLGEERQNDLEAAIRTKENTYLTPGPAKKDCWIENHHHMREFQGHRALRGESGISEIHYHKIGIRCAGGSRVLNVLQNTVPQNKDLSHPRVSPLQNTQ